MLVFFIVSFLVWPFGTVLLSFNNAAKKWCKNILWLFVIFYGYTFVLSNEMLDANRILTKFQAICYSNLSFVDVLKYYYFDNVDGTDIIQPIIFYIVSLLTDNFHILMAVLGAIFGYFYSRNFDYLLQNSKGKIKPYNYLILTLFLLVIGFWEINRFRFFASATIFYYCVAPFIFENRTSRLWLLPLTFLLHFSFLFPLVVLAVYLVLRNRMKLYFLFFLISFFLVSLNATAIGEFLINYLPHNLHSKIAGYTDAEYIARQEAESIRSISSIMRYLMYFIINLYFVIFYFFYRNHFTQNSFFRSSFSFTLLFMASSNFISIIPSGDRFIALSSLFSLSFLFFFFQILGFQHKHRFVQTLSVPVFLISAVGFLRLSFDTVNIMAIIGNPIISIIDNTHKALIEFF